MAASNPVCRECISLHTERRQVTPCLSCNDSRVTVMSWGDDIDLESGRALPLGARPGTGSSKRRKAQVIVVR